MASTMNKNHFTLTLCLLVLPSYIQAGKEKKVRHIFSKPVPSLEEQAYQARKDHIQTIKTMRKFLVDPCWDKEEMEDIFDVAMKAATYLQKNCDDESTQKFLSEYLIRCHALHLVWSPCLCRIAEALLATTYIKALIEDQYTRGRSLDKIFSDTASTDSDASSEYFSDDEECSDEFMLLAAIWNYAFVVPPTDKVSPEQELLAKLQALAVEE